MATKTSPLPKSKAKTAYQLLSEIRKLILAEPKRYNQFRYLQLVGADEFGGYGDQLDPNDAAQCGTRGCIGGWVVVLTESEPVRYNDIERTAMTRLGLTYPQAIRLFSPSAADGIEGTEAHAQSGAAHIARFQEKYAAQLKAKRV